MIISVGTKNKAKIEAVKEISKEYGFLNGLKVVGKEVSSGVSEQPKTMEETARGAINRAKNAFGEKSRYSIGIEDGLAKVPYTKTGYMNFCFCAVYDGKEIRLGVSSGYENPKEITKMIFEKNMNTTDAFLILGLADDKNIGSKNGVIGILTKNRLTRKGLAKEALRNALIQIENRELY